MGAEDECWLWMAGVNNTGYGRIRANGEAMLAHRVAWFMANGEFPLRDVLHSCDNPRCVNPKHLRLGSHADNMRDMAKRLRSGNRKLSPSDVKEIRRRLASGEKQWDVARAYGLRQCSISDIKLGKTWGHVV